MAVYTDVSADELTAFLKDYDIGELLSYKGIAEGVENSNFLLHTSKGAFILTLYEKRVAADDLPFFLSLMAHLAARGVELPAAGEEPQGRGLFHARRTARGGHQLPRRHVAAPAECAHCAGVGEALAKMHLAGARLSAASRKNPLSVAGWRPLFKQAAERANEVQHGLYEFLSNELDHLERSWPRDLPQGVIHADLFPDNVFFLGDKLSGLIDFPFACTDMLAYDVAICLNAWCFEPDAFVQRHQGARAVERLRPRACAVGGGAGCAAAAGARIGDALPADAAGRLAQRAAGRAGAAEGSARIRAQAALPSDRRERARLWARAIGLRRVSKQKSDLPQVTIHTDGACSGNPGPGGWGAILKFGDVEKELKGGERDTTNNRMELLAAISALEAMKKPVSADIYTDSQYVRGGITSWIHNWKRNGWKTADKKPVKNVDLWQRLDAAHEAARRALALGQGPRRPPRKRTRRPARPRRAEGKPVRRDKLWLARRQPTRSESSPRRRGPIAPGINDWRSALVALGH